ncbi:MAG TPA: hypothetical protein VH044_03180 [Polyangiaceae bacterium]|jgi:hypothetical protein|nr:hypothetical protein [Polyangiaceae bacterium]
MRSYLFVLIAAQLSVAALGVACTSGSPPAADDAQAPLPPITNTDASPDAPSSAVDAGAADGSPAPGDGAGPDATLDGGAEAAGDGNTGTDATSPLGAGCRAWSSTDGGLAGAGALPGCGAWVAASGPGAGIDDTVQLTTTGRGTGLGAVVDWNTTGGTGSGEFADASAAGATFTCLTPGTVVVTATDPTGADCGAGTYDQASIALQCDAHHGPWAAVSISSVSGCGVTTAGSVRCWSDETLDGVLGNGTTLPSAFPAQVSGLASDVVSLSVGNDFACALAAGGGVQCWGAIPPRSGLGSEVPVAIANLASGATAIAAGGQSACALTASRGVLCWGTNGSGELGNGTTSDSASAVAVTGLTGNPATLAVGFDFACVATTTGAVQCWGDDSSGELGGPSTGRFSASPVAVVGLPAPVTAVTAGAAFACALTSTGDVYCWGANDGSQLGSFSGPSSPTPVHVDGLPQDIRAIAAGQSFACALTSGGAVLCWGDDTSGQLGNGSFGSRSASPVQVSGLTSGVASISLGGQSACAITFAGDLLCWGSNDVAQIGDAPTTFCSMGSPSARVCAPYPTSIEGAGPGAIVCGPAPLDGGEPDAASGWCQQQGAHTLCEDFDQGVPGKLSPHLTAGSTIGEDDAPSRALLATTSPVAPQDVESTAFGTYVSPVAGASFRVQADFKIGSDCFANGYRPVTLVRVDYLDVGYTLAYSASPGSSGSGWVMEFGDVETTPQTPGPFGGNGVGTNTFLPTNQWARLTLWADLGSKSGGNGVQVLAPNGPAESIGGGIFGPSQTPASAPVLRIGVDAATHGCSVDIDNVLFDVTP